MLVYEIQISNLVREITAWYNLDFISNVNVLGYE